jgi:hypothetical protein
MKDPSWPAMDIFFLYPQALSGSREEVLFLSKGHSSKYVPSPPELRMSFPMTPYQEMSSSQYYPWQSFYFGTRKDRLFNFLSESSGSGGENVNTGNNNGFVCLISWPSD